MEVSVSKGIHGWRAETCIELPNDRELCILTSKRHDGRLTSTATVSKRDGMWCSHTVFEDFAQTLTRSDLRCTEKNVRAQHDMVLTTIDSIKERVTAHYATKEGEAHAQA